MSSFTDPLRGPWRLRDATGQLLFPAEVVVASRRFRKAGWRERKDGVVEQYREVVPYDSMHLCVMEDGSWLVNHTDSVNPDVGGLSAAVRHFFVDTAAGRRVTATVVLAGLVAMFALAAETD